MQTISGKGIEKSFLIIAFSLITLIGFEIYQNPAKGYELSIYNQSQLIWLGLIICEVIGFIVLYKNISMNNKNFVLVFIGSFMIVLTKFIVLVLPYLRGYIFISHGDTLTHVGIIKDILIFNSIGDNFYPITHLLYSIFSLSTGLSPETVIKYLTPILSIVYLLFILVLGKKIFPKGNIKNYIFIAMGVIYSTYFYAMSPNGLSILFLPLIILCLLSKDIRYVVILTIFLAILPFFHPLTALITISFIIGIFIIKCVNDKYLHVFKFNTIGNNRYFLLGLIGFESIIFVSWVLSVHRFYKNLRELVSALVSNVDDSMLLSSMNSKLTKMDIKGIDIIILAFKMYTIEIIFIIFFIISIYILYRRRKYKDDGNYIICCFLALIVLMTYGATLTNIIPGMESLAGHRALIYLLAILPLSIGYCLEFGGGIKTRYIFVAILICASAFTMVNIYKSPYVNYPNEQVTQMDLNGMKWALDSKEPQRNINTIISNPERFSAAIYGNRDTKTTDSFFGTIPDHFKYRLDHGDPSKTLDPGYLVIPEYDKQLYLTVWKNIGRFDLSDFDKIDLDGLSSRVYTNGEVNTYYAQ